MDDRGSRSRVLVLDTSYVPLTTVSVKRAIILVFAEKADIVEAGDGEIRSASASLPVPSVIRINRVVRVPYARRAPLTRRSVLARDNHQCCYCTDRKGTTIDHIVPRSRGGRNEWKNVVASCARCNMRKADRTPEEAGMTMRFKPTVPSGTKALVVVIGTVAEEWRPYLGLAAA